MSKKKILLSLIAISLTLNAFANPIHSYQSLVSAMHAGNYFVILSNLQQCTGKSDMPTGYFTPNAMLLVPATATAPEHIATADLHFTDGTGNPNYEYIKYTFNPDNSVVIRTTVYNPQNFQPVGTDHVIHCALDKGVEVNTVTLMPHE
jgi:hypothetical protein